MDSRIPHSYSGQVAGTVVNLDSTGPQHLRLCVLLNTTAAVAYLQIFNIAAGSVTLGTTVPWLSIGLPASAAMVLPLPEGGILAKGSGLSVAGTTTRTGSTGAAIDVNIGWGR